MPKRKTIVVLSEVHLFYNQILYRVCSVQFANFSRNTCFIAVLLLWRLLNALAAESSYLFNPLTVMKKGKILMFSLHFLLNVKKNITFSTS